MVVVLFPTVQCILFMWKEDVNFPAAILTTESSHEILSRFISSNLNHSLGGTKIFANLTWWPLPLVVGYRAQLVVVLSFNLNPWNGQDCQKIRNPPKLFPRRCKDACNKGSNCDASTLNENYDSLLQYKLLVYG